jgi:hypothetical protein
MFSHFQAIVRSLVAPGKNRPGHTRINAPALFNPEAEDAEAQAQSLIAAFLLALGNGDKKVTASALEYMGKMRGHPALGEAAHFLEQGLEWMDREVQDVTASDPEMANRITAVRRRLETGDQDEMSALRDVWSVLFPEGLAVLDDRKKAVRDLRSKRTVHIVNPNPEPITDPLSQVLFTGNALLTLPQENADFSGLDLAPDFQDRVEAACRSQQQYWYDHPIPLGIDLDRNEVLYGLRGLADALAFEKKQHPDLVNQNLTCVLSVSVTHDGLHGLGREYLTQALSKADGLDGLDVYLFTETETDRMKQDVLFPAMEKYFPHAEHEGLDEVLGVDGEYGRHYSFLKAVAAFWHVLADPKVGATFKIDLDQIFPQNELLTETGKTALEHLQDNLWGATGRDYKGEDVELGLLAGALVNQSDISQGLFTPDVPWPDHSPKADEWVFFSTLPQAQSTLAEMMATYDADDLDGKSTCLQRIHVTGGTTGALVSSLRRHRPFTPTFIGRAEDQAFILSALFHGSPQLRYFHRSGLIMRHDKAALIPEAIASAKTGKIVGDYARMLWFSHYAQILPWPLADIKAVVDPFTGCFISELPITVVFMRLCLKAADMFQQNDREASRQAMELLILAARRLENVIRRLETPAYLESRYKSEQTGWNLFYDVLDKIEDDLKKGEPFALDVQEKARQLIQDCKAL